MAMTLVSTVVLSTTGQILITNIPQTGKDLLLLVSGRVDNTNKDGALRFNNDSGSNYTLRTLEGSGSAASSASETTSFIRILNSQSGFTTNTFTNQAIYVANYTSTTNKSISVDEVTENNATQSFQRISAGLYTTSSGITQLEIFASTIANSSASLYIIS
jgi:hypothetical protein